MPIIDCIKIDCIKSGFAEAIVNHCSERSCKLKLTGLSNHIILKGEKICNDRRICDCIIFTIEDEQVVIGIIELKGRTAHSSEIEEKLTNGLEIASDILEQCNIERFKSEFYLIALCKSLKSSEYRIISSRKIYFRGKRYDIIPKKCGLSFFNLILRLR